MARGTVAAQKKAHPHEKPHHPHAPLAGLLFAAVIILGLLSAHEPGTWIHIKTGARIVAGHALPSSDQFSYTVAGRPWTTDSWLSDVLFFRVHQVFGPRGLIVLKSLAAAAGFALLLPVNPASPVLAAFVLGLGAVCAWTGLTEMPAVFDFLLMALMIRTLRPRRLFHWSMACSVAGLELLWANLHGATAALGVWLIALKVFKTSMRTAARERLNYLVLLAVAALALACNPHGPAVVLHMFTGLEASSSAWQPPWAWLNSYSLFAAAGAVACLFCLQQEFFLTMTTASLIALGLIVPPMRALSVMACCPTISLALGHLIAPIDDRPRHVAVWTAAMAALIGLYWALVSWPLASWRGYGVPGIVSALEFVSANKLSGRMFNEAEAGAGIIGRGDAPVFVDERAALYGPSFMADAASWPVSFARLDDVYHFDYAILLNRRRGYPARALDEDPRWALAYADDAALVYVSRPGPDAQLAPVGRPLARPNDPRLSDLDEALSRPASAHRLLRELDDWLLRAPDAAQPLIWKAYALRRLGQEGEAQRLVELASRRPRLWRDPELLAALGRVADLCGEPELAGRCRWRARLLGLLRGDSD